MKQKGIPKEKLTMDNIRSDLRKKLWKSWLLLAVEIILFAGLGYLTVQNPVVLITPSRRWFNLPYGLILLFDFVLVALLAKHAWQLYTGYRKQPIVVKDTLVSSEGDSYYSSHSWRTAWCTLHFNCYGDYSVPEKNYSWSKQYAMSAQGVDNLAFEGGEYYLVLSRPHSGKILLAYNAELFELESEKVEEIS